MKFQLWFAALLMFGVAGVASAQSAEIGSGFYAGAFGGLAKYPDQPRVVVGSFTMYATNETRDDASWGIAGGYRFGKYFAIDAGYIDLGEGTASLAYSAGIANLRFRARGETLGFAGILPFGSRWEAYAKLGLMHQDVDFGLSGTQSGAPFALSSNSHDGVKLYQEAGISCRFDTHWKTTLAVSHFPNVGKQDVTGQVNILNTSLGIYYQF